MRPPITTKVPSPEKPKGAARVTAFLGALTRVVLHGDQVRLSYSLAVAELHAAQREVDQRQAQSRELLSQHDARMKDSNNLLEESANLRSGKGFGCKG